MRQGRIRVHAPGFTLVELLVVIGVVGVLAGMVTSVAAKARSRVRSVTCLGNLRQWGVATHLYTTDHSGWLPKDGAPNGASRQEGWYVELPRTLGLPAYYEMAWRTNAFAPAAKSIWICPANSRRSNGNNLFHYCLNGRVNGSGAGRRMPLSAVTDPSRTVWLFDNGRLAAVARQNNVHTNLHQEGAQFLFLDGHAARFESRDYWDFNRHRGLTNHPALRWTP